MAKDPVKVRVKNIIAGVVSAFKENDSEKGFETAASALVKEAFDLGVKVGKGEIPSDLD